MLPIRMPILLIGLMLVSAPGGAAEPVQAPARFDRHGDPLPQGALLRLGTVRFRQGTPIYSLVFSPDGKKLATFGYADPQIHVWDYQNGRELFRLDGESGPVAFSPDGTKLAQASDVQLQFWSAADGKRLEAPPLQFPPIDFAYAPDGKKIAFGCLDDVVRITDANTGKELLQVTVRDGNPVAILQRWLDGRGLISDSVPTLAYAPDGKSMAAANDGVVVLFDTEKGKILRRFRLPLSLFSKLTFSP
ncbi:MAG: WD40 repeat domain-containing protein, partial [Gemmataceae bacterium]